MILSGNSGTWIDDFILRLRQSDLELNFLADHEDAISAFRDSYHATQSSGALAGKIIGLKDNIAMAGVRTGAGMFARRHHVAQQDADIVQRLKKAGALLLPRLNMDEAAFGATTANPHYQTTINPLQADHTAGGSSGGSAAVVAADIVSAAFGTDTLGSVRIPASYCGIAGFKPSHQLIDLEGVFPLHPDFDTLGILAKNVKDISNILAGCGYLDMSRGQSHNGDLSGVRFALPRQIDDVECSAAVRDGFERARRCLIDAGAILTDVDLVGWVPHQLRMAALLAVEIEASDGLAKWLEGASQTLQQALSYGALASLEKRQKMANQLECACSSLDGLFRDHDFLLMPTTPQQAFSHGDTIPHNQADFTCLANVTGVPSMALPVQHREGLPTSIQIMAPKGHDPALLETALALEMQLARH